MTHHARKSLAGPKGAHADASSRTSRARCYGGKVRHFVLPHSEITDWQHVFHRCIVRAVRRMELFEFHELDWFPSVWRDLVTDLLSFFFKAFKPYVCAAPVLAEAFERSGSDRILELCSGAGQPVLCVLPALGSLGCSPTAVILTDKYPNIFAFRAAVAAGGGLVSCIEIPVDSTGVPEYLSGFRTLFTSFHHLQPRELDTFLPMPSREEKVSVSSSSPNETCCCGRFRCC